MTELANANIPEKTPGPLRELTYTPESELRSPRRLVKSMIVDLRAAMPLGWQLAMRDISAKYRQSLLGLMWTFIPPIMTAFIFISLNSRKIITIDTGDVPYPVFVLFGTVLWRMFTSSMTAPLQLVTANKVMLSKLNFPRESLIVSAMVQVLYEFCISLLILAVVCAVYRVDFTWALPLFPVAALAVMLLGFTFGLVLAPVGSLYTDVTTLLTTITLPWMMITPVVYTKPHGGALGLISSINPVSPLITGARDLATGGSMTDPLSFAIVCCTMVVFLVAGWVVFRLAMPIIIERMGG